VVFHGSFTTNEKDFKKHIKDIASKSTQILSQELMKAGIIEDPEFNEMDLIFNRISDEGQQILLLAGEYNQKVSEWIDDIRHNSLPIDTEQRDAFKTILRYFQFIQPRLNRALIDSDREEPFPVQSDQNGSAQIALVAINRSIHAWSEMIHVNCRFENEGICCILLLNGMRKAVEGVFREVDKFVKPGEVEELRLK
jgi:hypothetical protein